MESHLNVRLFKTTQDAVVYGEAATLEEMGALLNQTTQRITAHVVEISVDMQLYNEAMHAFVQDEWYDQYRQQHR